MRPFKLRAENYHFSFFLWTTLHFQLHGYTDTLFYILPYYTILQLQTNYIILNNFRAVVKIVVLECR